jgi:uncharacterized phage protein (TIGR02218 family)
MRTLGNGIKGHIAGTAHTRATCLRLDLKDGTILAVTDHDKALSFDLGDGAATYSAATGILPTDLDLSVGFDSDDIEVSGPITETGLTTRAAFIGGRFDDAVARVFQVNWADLSQGSIPLLKGYVVLADVAGGRFKLTIHSEISRFAQEIGRTITAYCDADFGDARCGYTPATLAATVTAVTDTRTFTVSFTGTYADDYWNKGTVQFTSGALAGTRPIEIFDWSASGAVALWTAMAQEPEIGATLLITQGCEKTRAACLAYDNVINFRGFPDVPGSDQVLRYPNPAG